nr:MAG TPA: portal [Bacteriophage sp.]
MSAIRTFANLVFGSTPNMTSWGARQGSPYAPVQSNIISPGSLNSSVGGGVDAEKIYSIVGTSLTRYLERIDELTSYLEFHITKTSIDVIKDALMELIITDNPNIISLPDDPEAEADINRILNEMQLIKHITSDISELIYYGSYSYAMELTDDNKSCKLRYLKNPTKVISTWKDSKLDSYFTYDMAGEMHEFNKNEIFSISTYDYKLEFDENISSDRLKQLNAEIEGEEAVTKLNVAREKSKRGVTSYDKRYLAGTPLFGYITGKIKEYILKDYLLSILSIKDLIQPIILLVGLEKTTALEEGVDLTQKVESLINKNLDMSFMEAKGLSVKDLAMSLIDNIRVLPDYDSKLAGMTDLNLDKISEKIDRIRMDQQTIKEDLINAIGLPPDLFEGRASRWESIKMSQRFESKVSYYVDMINKSVVLLAENLYDRLKLSKKLDIEGKITSNLMDTDSLEYTKKVARMDTLAESVNRIADLANIVSGLEQNQLVEIKALKEYIKEGVKKFNDPAMAKMINPDKKPVMDAFGNPLPDPDDPMSGMNNGMMGDGGYGQPY